MSKAGLTHRVVLLSVLLALAAVSGCGQMGPLQLPATAEPVTDSTDDDRDDDER